MRNLLFLFLIFIVGNYSSAAQKYTTAGGIRIGSDFGITVQQSLWDNYTLEGIVQKGLFSKVTSVSALFEQHHKLISKGTNFYVGGGPHMGFYSTVKATDKEEAYKPKNAVGLTLIGGLEFRLGKTLLSFDYKPAFNIVGGTEFINGQAAISLRYIFIKAHKQKKEQKWKFWQKKDSDK